MELVSATKANKQGLAAISGGVTRYPFLGIIMTALATFMAVNLVPDNPEPTWALFASAMVMAVGLAIAPIAAAVTDVKSILRGEHLLALSPIYWLLLDLLQGAYPLIGVNADQVANAFYCIGIFVIGVWLAAMGRQWQVPELIVKSVSVDFSANTYFSVAVIAFVVGMLKFAIPTNFDVFEMVYYLGQMRWAAPWGRGQLGGWDAFLDHLQYFGYLLPAITVIIAKRCGWLNVRTVISAAMSVIMAIFLAQSGSRRVIGVIFGMAFILWILSQERLKIKHIVITVFGATLLLVVLQVMVEYRGVGLGQMFIEEQREEMSLSRRDYLHVDDNIYRLSQIIGLIPSAFPYVYQKYIVWILIRPIPRVIWPGKPIDPGFDLPSALGVEGVSYSCSVIGELYMSMGMLAVFIGGWFYGRLAGMASRLLTSSVTFGSLIIYSTLMMALFSGMRSMLELMLVSYVVLAWAALSSVFIRLKKR